MLWKATSRANRLHVDDFSYCFAFPKSVIQPLRYHCKRLRYQIVGRHDQQENYGRKLTTELHILHNVNTDLIVAKWDCLAPLLLSLSFLSMICSSDKRFHENRQKYQCL